MIYVIHTPDGKLTGCFNQDLHPDHASAYIEVPADVAAQWVNFHAIQTEIEIGEDDDGPVTAMIWMVELAPVVPPEVVVPQSVTMRQARLALLGAGMLTSVNATIAGMPGALGEAARIEWEFSSEVKRQQPLVLQMMPALGLTAPQLDALFIAAAAL